MHYAFQSCFLRKLFVKTTKNQCNSWNTAYSFSFKEVTESAVFSSLRGNSIRSVWLCSLLGLFPTCWSLFFVCFYLFKLKRDTHKKLTTDRKALLLMTLPWNPFSLIISARPACSWGPLIFSKDKGMKRYKHIYIRFFKR